MEKKGKTTELEASSRNGVRRMIIALVAIGLELLIIIANFTRLSGYAEWVNIITHVAALALVLAIYNLNQTAAIRLTWTILILLAPILGVSLYLLIGTNYPMRKMRKRYREVGKRLFPLLPENDDVISRLATEDKRAANIARYIHGAAGYPAWQNTDVVYYDDGVDGLEAQKEELCKAEQFIFMEYHAIENAESWRGIEEILEERAAAGVDVRVFYDDMGSIGFIGFRTVNIQISPDFGEIDLRGL